MFKIDPQYDSINEDVSNTATEDTASLDVEFGDYYEEREAEAPVIVRDLAASGMEGLCKSVGLRRGAGQLKRADGIVGPALPFSHPEGAAIPS
jgi:hypothetical protein